jgi:hypothetical protein
MARTHTSRESLESDRVRTEDVSNRQPSLDNEAAPAAERQHGMASRLRQKLAAVGKRLPAPMRKRLPRFTRWRLALLAGILLLMLLWSGVAATSTSIYSAQFLVTATTNTIAPPDALFDFGGLPPTASITHKLTLKNDGKLNTYVTIMVFGNIRAFLDIDDAFFNLKPGQEREIDVKLTVPSTAQPDKQYNGRVVVTRLPWWSP